MAWKEFAHAPEQGVRPGHVLQGEVEVEGTGLDVDAESRVWEERLHLGCEEKGAGRSRIVEGLDPEAVAGEQQSLSLCIPQCESEHPLEQVYGRVAVFLVQVHQDFRVATGGKAMSLRLEAGAQLAVIVDLAIEHDDDGAVLVGDRLMAARHVDDAEALGAEADAVGDVEALVVRPAVDHGVRHSLQHRSVQDAYDATDPAHCSARSARLQDLVPDRDEPLGDRLVRVL